MCDIIEKQGQTGADTAVLNEVIYDDKLVDVDRHGVSTFHGPVAATLAASQLIYLPLILK
ncbi:MAG: hypothetical protein GY869_13900 [Planctomycetes bacterium]|nr:hypothetical protein [Planctomycetota bacterium]